MSIHVVNLVLDILFGGLAAYRIHRGSLLESGSFLRLGIFLLAMWRGFGDVHEITNWFDWGEGIHYGPFRDAVSELILFVSMALDLSRNYQRKRSMVKVDQLISDAKKQ